MHDLRQVLIVFLRNELRQGSYGLAVRLLVEGNDWAGQAASILVSTTLSNVLLG